VSTNAGDYIFYESQTSALHQEHIILHEVGHLLCEHRVASLSRDEVSELLLPDLDPAMIRRVLGRTCYPVWAEQEAEIIASLILAKVERQRRETALSRPASVVPVVARVERSLSGASRTRLR
jgi:hypothetical protein